MDHSPVVRMTFDQAPIPTGPFCHATKVGNLVFLTGQVPADPQTGNLIDGSFAEQTERVMANLQIVLLAAGSDFKYVVQARVFITDMRYFAEMNEVYRRYFGSELPSRTCIGVTHLADGADVEIDMIAYIPSE